MTRTIDIREKRTPIQKLTLQNMPPDAPFHIEGVQIMLKEKGFDIPLERIQQAMLGASGPENPDRKFDRVGQRGSGLFRIRNGAQPKGKREKSKALVKLKQGVTQIGTDMHGRPLLRDDRKNLFVAVSYDALNEEG